MKKIYNFKIKAKIKKSILTITIYYNPVFIKSIILGLFLSTVFIFAPNLIQPKEEINTNQEVIVNQNIPQQIQIPTIDLDIPINPATVTANDWQVFDDAVSWLNTSGDLSNGNIILYAHNEKNAFGKIIQMGVGNEITLTSNGVEKKYQVTDIFTATPKDTYLLEKSSENILTMYTCSGWFDQDRFFVIARPIN